MEVDGHEVTRLGRTARCRAQLRELVAQALDLRVDLSVTRVARLLGSLDALVLTQHDLGHDGHGGGEGERLAELGHVLVVVHLDLGSVDRIEAEIDRRLSEPAAHSVLDGVGDDHLVAQALPHHRERRLAWPKAGKAHLADKLLQLGVESFLQLFAGNLDRKLDRVPIALTEASLHIVPFID